MQIPSGFPEPSFPPDNSFNEARFLLGRKLFYDPVLSSDSTVSCSSCHKPEYAFTDRKKISEGIQGRIGTRNAISLGNVAYQPYLLREGGVPTLEMQVQVPIQEHSEFDNNILLISDKLNKDSEYIKMSLLAYDRTPDPFVITRAIACFERALLTGDSPFDRYSNGDTNALSAAAKNGFYIFNGKGKCIECHNGINFTNYSFLNNGLYEIDPDIGRMRLTNKEEDRSLFKVPSLRNVEITFPYMHDGSIGTLDEVIDHYASGGKPNPHKSSLVTGFTISPKEKEDLIAFLKSLTDYIFIINQNFRNK